MESGIETIVQLVWSPHGTHVESGMKLKKHGATNEIAEQSSIYCRSENKNFTAQGFSTSASPRIQACDTRPLLLTRAGWGLGMRLLYTALTLHVEWLVDRDGDVLDMRVGLCTRHLLEGSKWTRLNQPSKEGHTSKSQYHKRIYQSPTQQNLY